MICPVCRHDGLFDFLRRTGVPVHQNLVFHDQQEATRIERGDLELLACIHCGFVFNAAFEPEKLRYGAAYDNTQNCSPYFEKYLQELARYLLTDKGLRDSSIIEVGCGKGHFLRKLVEPEGFNNHGYGFDPSYVGPELDCGGRLHFLKHFFNSTCAPLQAEAVICRHVIEHEPRPVELLKAIRSALAHDSASRIYFETPCLEWILKNRVVWDLFYEHCSYFSAESLTAAMAQAGFIVQETRHIFGGQYLWIEAIPCGPAQSGSESHGEPIIESCRNFALQELSLIRHWRIMLEELVRKGNVAFWGAGAKGVTLANLIDPERELITCIVDLNPRKQGGFLPGTGHPIISYTDLPAYRVRSVIQMNPNYTDENLALTGMAQIDVDFINPSDWQVM